MEIIDKPKLEVDIHSHLIPGIDDGVSSLEDSLEIIRFFEHAGYKKLITTPHIKPSRYPNQPADIRSGLLSLQEAVEQEGINVIVEAAAEYYIDETFLSLIVSKDEVLTFGDNYILMETSFYNKPVNLEEIIFEIKAAGYRPVLAHPERYQYLENDLSWLKSIKEHGILFQVTLTSLEGYYGHAPKEIARKLINEGMADFLGSDIHRPGQIELNKKALKNKYVRKALKTGLLNGALIN